MCIRWHLSDLWCGRLPNQHMHICHINWTEQKHWHQIGTLVWKFWGEICNEVAPIYYPKCLVWNLIYSCARSKDIIAMPLRLGEAHNPVLLGMLDSLAGFGLRYIFNRSDWDPEIPSFGSVTWPCVASIKRTPGRTHTSPPLPIPAWSRLISLHVDQPWALLYHGTTVGWISSQFRRISGAPIINRY